MKFFKNSGVYSNIFSGLKIIPKKTGIEAIPINSANDEINIKSSKNDK